MNILGQYLPAFWLEIKSWVHIGPWHTNKFYQYQVDGLTDWVVHSFILIQSRPLYGWMIKNLWPTWTLFFCIFSCNIIEVNHYIQFFIFGCSLMYTALHTFPGPVPYGYKIIRSITCSLSSPLTLRTILLTFSVNTLCNSLLNFCCQLSIVLLLSRHFF